MKKFYRDTAWNDSEGEVTVHEYPHASWGPIDPETDDAYTEIELFDVAGLPVVEPSPHDSDNFYVDLDTFKLSQDPSALRRSARMYLRAARHIEEHQGSKVAAAEKVEAMLAEHGVTVEDLRTILANRAPATAGVPARSVIR